MTQDEHKALGIQLFNTTWDLIDLKDRSETQNMEMIHAAHASAYHWLQAGGSALNQARSQWQISRVYALLGMGESALFHGARSLQICKEHSISGLDLAFGYEAVARAYALLGNTELKTANIAAALEACQTIPEEGDRKYAEGEIQSIG